MKTIEQLRHIYAERIVDDMDTSTLMDIVFEHLMENLEKYSDDELKTEIEENYPDILIIEEE